MTNKIKLLVCALAAFTPAAIAADSCALPESRVEKAVLVQSVAPAYPDFAQRNGFEGRVKLSALVTSEGKVTEAKATRGSVVFVPAATEAVKQWSYLPATVNGVPTDSWVTVYVNFTRHK